MGPRPARLWAASDAGPYNPMPYDAAREMEVELGIALREAGYGVWQA